MPVLQIFSAVPTPTASSSQYALTSVLWVCAWHACLDRYCFHFRVCSLVLMRILMAVFCHNSQVNTEDYIKMHISSTKFTVLFPIPNIDHCSLLNYFSLEEFISFCAINARISLRHSLKEFLMTSFVSLISFDAGFFCLYPRESKRVLDIPPPLPFISFLH